MGTTEGKENAWKAYGKMKDNIKFDLKGIRWDYIDRICLD